MEKFGWCFIGTGSLAKQVATQLNKSGRHNIVSCYSRRIESAAEFAEKYGGKAYYTVEEAINADGVEGVYIVTPHNAHYRYAKISLEQGKPVFCEKPFTVTADETDSLISIAKERGLYICEAMWTWFSPAANCTKRWIDEQVVGKIKDAHFSYHIKTTGYKGRHTDSKRAGGALLDITIYPITYAYRLWGIPEKIESKAVIRNGIDLSDDIIFTYPGGFNVYITASIDDYKGLEYMTIKGDKGIIKAPFFHAMNKVSYKNSFFDRKTFRGNGPKVNSYLDEFDSVAEDIRAGKTQSEMVPLKATSDVMHILDKVRAQIGLTYDSLE